METNGSVRSFSPGHFFPSKPSPDTVRTHWESAEFAQQFPALYDLLGNAVCDGHWRAGATLSFFCEGGRLKASIYDRASQMVWFCTLKGDVDWLAETEHALQNGEGEWREKKHGK